MRSLNEAPSGAGAVMAIVSAPIAPTLPPNGERTGSCAVGANTTTPVSDGAQESTRQNPAPTSVGEMLRRAREARGLTIDVLAAIAATNAIWSADIVAAEFVRVENDDQISVMFWLTAYLDALGVSSQERDSVECAANRIPADVRALLLANPSKLDAVRELLGGAK